jgi:hypothetical protein
MVRKRKDRFVKFTVIGLGICLLGSAGWSWYRAVGLSAELGEEQQRHAETTVTFLDGAERYNFKKKSFGNRLIAWVLEDELIVGRYGGEMAFVWVPDRLADDFVAGLGTYRAQLRGPWRNTDKRGNIVYSFYSNGSYRKLQGLSGHVGTLFWGFFSGLLFYVLLPACVLAGVAASARILLRTSGFDIFHKRPS